ncbi:thiol:disulfide interchange protein DsbA/DsbL [Rheinheimera sp. WS51]|uniref:thiol:disulfide interchange protein DsbA/DsbL n=1 Tax=Rheinheimera sp. WS51 TaxID=3425886 RepID=UPI003D91FACE
MRKLFIIILLSFFIPLALSADEFKHGHHYDVIAASSSEKPEVVEFFSFYCPHCANFEPIAQRIEQQLPKNVSFTKMHVDFIRAASPALQNNLARAVLVADLEGKKHQVVDAIFEQIHKKRQNFTSPEQIRQLAISAGVTPESYDANIESFGVINAADYMKQQQTMYTEQRVLKGVPMLIVNGKYRINLENLDGDLEAELAKLIQFLISKDD